MQTCCQTRYEGNLGFQGLAASASQFLLRSSLLLLHSSLLPFSNPLIASAHQPAVIAVLLIPSSQLAIHSQAHLRDHSLQ